MFSYPINVTIDTNVFDSCKYDLSENSTLRILSNYVKDNKVKVYLSNIVIREAKAHLKKQAIGLYSKIRNNRKEMLDIADEDLISVSGLKDYILIPEKQDIIDKTWNRFNDFINSLKPIIFDNSEIDLDEIIDDYFDFNAPFEQSKEKRKEFPDAFIAKQIRSNFPEENSYIISNDKGFKDACSKDKQFVFLGKLGDLYNKISEQDANYSLAISIENELSEKINDAIRNSIIRYENITVYGLSFDRKGVASGHDYYETTLNSIKNVSHDVHIVDAIDENEAIITLNCSANIKMDCYYMDYNNAIWDSEEKVYIDIDSKHIVEKHKARFAVRLQLNLINKDFSLYDISIILGGDTIKDRYDVDDDIDEDDNEFYDTCPDCAAKYRIKMMDSMDSV